MYLALNFQRIDPTRGGAETYVADLCRRLVELGHRVDLYANEWREGVLPPEVRVIRVAAEGRTRLGRLWSFAVNSEAALRDVSFDCSVGLINTWSHDVLIPQGGVHAASLEANARRFAPGWRRSLYLATKRLNPKAWVYRAIERRQYDPARETRVVAVSNLVRGHLERFHGVPRERIRVIPNAIDAGRLAVTNPAVVRAAFRAEHGLGESDLVALFAGHNFRLKGLPDLLEALALRRRRDPSGRPVHLMVCGGGRVAPIRRLAGRLGLAGTVHLLGFTPEIRACYHASDLFVLPTYYDPCSLVVFEALASGLPVITTRCNGAGELITQGEEGFIIPAADAHVELADALDQLADDERRRAMSARAARLGRAQSFEKHVERLIKLFQEVAERRRSVARKDARLAQGTQRIEIY
jgi:UDP-glucose:(heptosyl)LPS alpha-1,3-glucosyltransferase